MGSNPMSAPQSGVTKVALNARRFVQSWFRVWRITGAS